MQDGHVPISALVTGALWLLTFALVASSWIVCAAGHHEPSVMLGFTACVFAVMAGTATVRCYALRGYRLLRVAADLDSERLGVRPLR